MRLTRAGKTAFRFLLSIFAVLMIMPSFLVLGIDEAWARTNTKHMQGYQNYQNIGSEHLGSFKSFDSVEFEESGEKPSEDDAAVSSSSPNRKMYAYTPDDSSKAADNKISWITKVINKMLDLTEHSE